MEYYSLDEKITCRKSIIKKSNKVKSIIPKSKNYPNPACTNVMKLNEKKKSISPRNLYFKNSPRIHFKYLIIFFQIYLFLTLLFPIVTQDTLADTPVEGGETSGEESTGAGDEDNPEEPEQDLRIREPQEIVVKIKNKFAPQYIIYPGFTNRPKFFCGAEELIEDSNKKVTITNSEETVTITLKWEYLLEDCKALFSNVSEIKEIYLTIFNTSKVVDMSNMFEGLKNLKILDYGEAFITSEVKNMEYMFSGCEIMTSFDLSKFDTSKVTDFACQFQNCKYINFLDLTPFDTSNADFMHYIFNGCELLTSIDISSFNTSKVTNVSRMCTIKIYRFV